MTIDTSFMAKRFHKFKSVFVLYSTATNLPFVECDEHTLDDQIYVFTHEEELQQYAKIYTKEKYGLKAVAYPGNRFGQLFAVLHQIGVDTLQVVDEGAPVSVKLELLSPTYEPEVIKGAEDLPASNPPLQLSGIYFMQMLRRPGERSREEKQRLKELEEEMAVNLIRAKFIVAFDATESGAGKKPGESGTKVKLPFVKNKSGKVFQPVYTDLAEFRRFNAQNKGLRLAVSAVDYDKLSGMLAKPAEGFVFNPGGINLILTPEQMQQMKKRYSP